MDNITISQIAEIANVSKTTVSRVINKKPDVSVKTREKIEGIIKQYDFTPNAFASAIHSKKSDTVGLVIPYDENYVFSNPYYSEIIRGVSSELKRARRHLMLVYSKDNDFTTLIRQKRVDGIIIVSPGRNHIPIIERLLEMDVPIVSTSRIPDISEVHCVALDDYKGACMAVGHLASLGHRRIGFINGPKTLASSMDRLKGYRDILGRHSISYDETIVINGDTSIESGYSIMHELLKDQSLTAVFAASDLMAIGAIRAITEYGLQVPHDISIVGFDDMPFSAYLNPPLTTIRQEAYKRGRTSGKMLIDLFAGKKVKMRSELPVELIVRNSTDISK
jgi:DNA-binding LacI/PurR family transcriptional regulator